MEQIGNRKNTVEHWPGCPDYARMSAQNRVTCPYREAARQAGRLGDDASLEIPPGGVMLPPDRTGQFPVAKKGLMPS